MVICSKLLEFVPCLIAAEAPMPPIIGIFMFDGGMFDDMHGCMFMPFIPFMPFMPPDVPWDIPMPEDMLGDMPDDIPDCMPVMPPDIPGDIPMPEDMLGDMPDDIPDCMLVMPPDIPGDIPMPEDMLGDMPDDIPDCMPADIPPDMFMPIMGIWPIIWPMLPIPQIAARIQTNWFCSRSHHGFQRTRRNFATWCQAHPSLHAPRPIRHTTCNVGTWRLRLVWRLVKWKIPKQWLVKPW